VSITQDLNVASSKGKLNQFFNSADNASALEGHNTALDRLIAGSTVHLQLSHCVPWVDFDSILKFVTVNEVRKSLREIEVSLTAMNDIHSLIGGVTAFKIARVPFTRT
jgi:hypothetical protein